MEENCTNRKRKNYSPEEKVAILKRHSGDKVAVSDLIDQYLLHPTVFYRWQKGVFPDFSGTTKGA